MRHPKRALSDGVLVTPTLVRLEPKPVQTIIGTLSDPARVVAALGLPDRPMISKAPSARAVDWSGDVVSPDAA
jgi:hypothetical protein